MGMSQESSSRSRGESECGQATENTQRTPAWVRGLMSAIFWTFSEHHPKFDPGKWNKHIVMDLSIKTVFRQNAKTNKPPPPKTQETRKEEKGQTVLAGDRELALSLEPSP